MWSKGFINDALDWAADKVQTISGEKERRKLVLTIKEKYSDFKINIEKMINDLNSIITGYNNSIKKVNEFRKVVVGENISVLCDFLSKFGKVKLISEYAEENIVSSINIPEKQFEKKEEYIKEIDWTKEEVFCESLFSGPVGMRSTTRKQNLSMREQIGRLELEIDENIRQLEIKNFNIRKDQEISDLYLECITIISEYIKKTIIPELEIVEAFFQAMKMKNEVIAHKQIDKVFFSYDILLLEDTVYENHYLFIKNVFMFYIMSCRIYDTAVLTRLVDGSTEESDKNLLNNNKDALLQQKENVSKYILFARG